MKAELFRPNVALLDLPGLQATPELAKAFFDYQAEQDRERAAPPKVADAMASVTTETKPDIKSDLAKSDAPMADSNPAMQPGSVSGTVKSPEAIKPAAAAKEPPQPLNIIQKTFRAEALARLQRANIAESGFVERLVAFWSNHFCISANKAGLERMWCGSFEREAIRPHVLGHFSDMLKAVEQHPAMIFFLDNQQSMGTKSKAGLNRGKGINENLAREIMELHTLGVGGGYSQEDVTSLARIITGWTFSGRNGRLGPPGHFAFVPNFHEPGGHRLLGKVYEEEGLAQGEAALADIARHPATAKFIATKFARHFVADDPPPALVANLENVFRKTDGDFKAMTLALVDADEAWNAPMTKLRMPYEFLVASGRLIARMPEDAQRYLGGFNTLGQPLWTPPGPNGFPDTNAAWAAPENMKLRLDIAANIATRVGDAFDPRALLDVVAGEAASTETRHTVERAESKQQAFALLLMSPEFQRR